MTPVDPNFLDRVIAWASPSRAVKRLKARTMWAAASGAYKGGRRDRRATRRWRPFAGSANADTLPDMKDLRSRSRDLARNAPIATGAIATVTTNVVGDGLTLNPTVDGPFLGMTEDVAREWNAAAAREFALWCRTADFTGVQSFEELQGLAFRSVLESGDLFVLRHSRQDAGEAYGLKLQLVEADRVSNPKNAADTETMADGIENDIRGRRLACHFADRHPGAIGGKTLGTWKSVPFVSPASRNQIVLHLFDRLRPDQARGLPYLSPIITSLKELDDYAEAEIRAAVVSAMFTVFVTQDEGEETGDIIGTSEGTAGVNDANKEIALEGTGAIVQLDKGQNVEIANPRRPNAQFDPFVQAFLRQIGVALELPFELLIKHFTASYSASRAALEMARQFFRRRQKWLERQLLQPVYEWVIDEAVARGRLAAPGYFSDPAIRAAYCQAEWIGPSRMSLDPKKDAEADEINLRNKVDTRKEIISRRTGGKVESTITQLGHEKRLLKSEKLDGEAPPPAVPASPDPKDDDTDTEDEE